MARRNHIAKATGRIYNKLPKAIKPVAKQAIKKAPSKAEQGRKRVNAEINKLIFGKKWRPKK